MSNLTSELGYVDSLNYQYDAGMTPSGTGIAVPTWASVVEMFLKPNGGANEGSSIGVDIIFNQDNTTGNYLNYHRVLSNTTYLNLVSSVTNRASGFRTHLIVDGQSMAKIRIYPRGSSGHKQLVAYWGDDWTNDELWDSYAIWENTADEITNIDFVSSAAVRSSFDINIRFIR